MIQFAITIPNLNQSRFLGTVLESIRHQKKPYQLSVMDGGSTDNFTDAIRPYQDIITYWQSQKDGGQSAAITKGWDCLQGNIISWINADDYYFPDCFENVGKIFEKEKKVDVVYGDAIHVNENGHFISYFPAIREHDPERIAKDCYICQPACFIRRTAYKKIKGVLKELKYTMDWDLWCQLSNNGAIFKYVHKPFAAVRYYKGIKTLSRSLTRYKEIIRIERKYAKRKLPVSVLGADYYGMLLNGRRTFLEKSYILLFDGMRKIKNTLGINKANRKHGVFNQLYGLRRWGFKVDKECTIYLPWYSIQSWTALLIFTEYRLQQLRIQVNGSTPESFEQKKGIIYIKLDASWRPCLKILLGSKRNDEWIIQKIKCI